jgi:hypothetical protein
MTKVLIILMSTIFLGATSCKRKIICSEINSTDIKPLVSCDISFQFNRCRCRCFDLDQFQTVDDKFCSDFRSGDYPLEYCEGLSGFFIEDMAINIKPNIIHLNEIKADNCK